jgi:hypothetical protein
VSSKEEMRNADDFLLERPKRNKLLWRYRHVQEGSIKTKLNKYGVKMTDSVV